MSGKIKKMLDKYLELRCVGNKAIKSAVIAKMTLKGVNPKNWDENSPDDREVIKKIKEIAKRHNINWKDLLID